jgi:hypothetical protein
VIVYANDMPDLRGAVSYIGADNETIQYLVSKYLFATLGGKGKIVYLEGTPRAATTVPRKSGLSRSLKEFPGIELLASQTGLYQRRPASEAMESLLPRLPDGGAMVGLQAAPMKMLLGPLINGFVNFEFWLPVPRLEFPGTADLVKKYPARAPGEHVDALGYYTAPWGYAQLQVLQQALEAAKGFDDKELAGYIRATTFKTVVGDIKFGAKGEWRQSRMLQVQFRNIKGNDLAQFRDTSTEVVVSPAEYASGPAIYPYQNARQ